ncbi:MAG: tripartite tricarboxylate transporter TctB family protein [Alphaproteobacteria bacterium]
MIRRSGGRIEVSELAIGLVLLALAAVVAGDARGLAPGSIYGVGPGVAPMMVAGGLALLGLATVFAAWRPRPAAGADAAEAGAIDWAAVVVIVATLAAMIALMTLGGGFILASTALFAGTAWAFGRRAPAADVLIGLALALIVYAVFTRALTLALPEGPLEKLVQHALDPLVRALPWPW